MKRPRRLDTANALAEYLKSAMAAQQLTGLALAKRAGVGQSHISRIMKCTSAPTIDILDRIASALGVTLADMFAGAPPPAADPVPVEDVADAKRVARLATAFAKCDDRAQKIVLDLVEKLAASRVDSRS